MPSIDTTPVFCTDVCLAVVAACHEKDRCRLTADERACRGKTEAGFTPHRDDDLVVEEVERDGQAPLAIRHRARRETAGRDVSASRIFPTICV
jgi:hypothetical protein